MLIYESCAWQSMGEDVFDRVALIVRTWHKYQLHCRRRRRALGVRYYDDAVAQMQTVPIQTPSNTA